jgi:hypothetical protein
MSNFRFQFKFVQLIMHFEEIQSTWNYTSGQPLDDTKYHWLVFDMLENQNYTAQITIGNEVSAIQAYFTQDEIKNGASKCDMYDDAQQMANCESVSAISTQFQVAFPYISLSFTQEFNFTSTSSGNYDNAPMGEPAYAHCGAESCSGLGLATVRADGTRLYEQDLYSLMPDIVKDPSGTAGEEDEWMIKIPDGKSAQHANAEVPVFTFIQDSSPAVEQKFNAIMRASMYHHDRIIVAVTMIFELILNYVIFI